MNSEHYDLLITNCDINNDGNISYCEMVECVTKTENTWRDEYCPMYGNIECIDEIEEDGCPVEECEECWYCQDVI